MPEPRIDAAMAAAIKRAVFARPAASPGRPNQTMQGNAGAQGAPFGRGQGYIGAAVPQMGAQKTPGAMAPGAPPGEAGPGSSPLGGLAQFAPLLPILAMIFAHLFGGGGATSTPRAGGQI